MLRAALILGALCLSLSGLAGQVSADPPPQTGPSLAGGPIVNPPPVSTLPPDPQRYLYPNALGNAPPLNRPLSGYDHIPYTGYGPLAGYYSLPPNGYPPNGFSPVLPGPYTPHYKDGLTKPPVDTPPRQKPYIRPIHTGPTISHLRTAMDVHERAPEGCPEPLGCSNFYTEFKFVFGSCRDWFGTAESTYGQFRRTYVIP